MKVVADKDYGWSVEGELNRAGVLMYLRECDAEVPDRGHNRDEMVTADGAQFVDGLIQFLAGECWLGGHDVAPSGSARAARPAAMMARLRSM